MEDKKYSIIMYIFITVFYTLLFENEIIVLTSIYHYNQRQMQLSDTQM